MTLSRRHLLHSLAAAALPLTPAIARAEAYPGKVMSLTIGFPPGGPTDVTARVMQPLLAKALGGAVIVENVPGAGGSLAVKKTLNAAPDGHTLLMATMSDVAVTPMALASAKYKPENLVLTNKLCHNEFMLATRPGLVFKDVGDLVAQSKARELSYGSFGIGSLFHLLTEDFRGRSGAQLLHVPYQGMAPVINALLGEQIDIALLPLAGQALGLVKEGRVKPVFVASPKRLASLPNVPAADEHPASRGFHHTIWPGIFVPVATPADLQQKISTAVGQCVLAPEFRKYCDETAAAITDPQLTLAQAARFYAEDTARLRAIAQSIKLEAK